MPNAAADEARSLDDRELTEAVTEAYRELFNLRFQKGTHQLSDHTAIGRARRQIARLRTIQRERVLATARGDVVEPATAPAARALSPQKRRALEERAAAEADEAAPQEPPPTDASTDEEDAPRAAAAAGGDESDESDENDESDESKAD